MPKKRLSRNPLLCLITLLVPLFTSLPGTAYADTFEKAQTQFDNGEYKQALKILKPMAKNNHVEAQNLIGLMYAKGSDNFPVNDTKAVFWFNKAAQQGHDRASKNLAFLEANGRGTGSNIISDDTADEDNCEEE